MRGFERFSSRAKNAFIIGGEQARNRGSEYVHPAHVLYGLISAGEGNGVAVIQDLLNIDIRLSFPKIKAIMPSGEDYVSFHRSHAVQTTKVKNAAIAIARDEFPRLPYYIGTEHLTLALLTEGDGATTNVLNAAGVTEDNFRQALRDYPCSSED